VLVIYNDVSLIAMHLANTEFPVSIPSEHKKDKSVIGPHLNRLQDIIISVSIYDIATWNFTKQNPSSDASEMLNRPVKSPLISNTEVQYRFRNTCFWASSFWVIRIQHTHLYQNLDILYN